MHRPILVLNAGSSSIKCALFDGALKEQMRVEATGVGTGGALKIGGQTQSMALPDNGAALRAVAQALSEHGTDLSDLALVAHRVVHGGASLTAPARITPDVRSAIQECVPLAPLHNPHHLEVIDWVTANAPDLVQVASFDTAFHATIPPLAHRYALPQTQQTEGVRRYGFHGNSYAALVDEWHNLTGTDLPKRLLAMHLGNGASLCAILNGRSVATTMGFSPLGGLTMGTRCGVMDPGAVLELVKRLGREQTDFLLSSQSGLLGLSGESSDMRSLSESGSEAAEFARAHFAYWAARQAGSMMVAMGGCDAIAFTGGIGEHDAAIRAQIAEHLSWNGTIPQHVIPAMEEAYIARQAADLMRASSKDAHATARN